MPVDPTKLRFSPYRTPRFKLGKKIVDESRGEVTIVAISDGPIPWPIGAIRGWDRSLILCGDLVKAVRKEAAAAVRHWWGVRSWPVWKWRKTLEGELAETAVRTDRLHHGTGVDLPGGGSDVCMRQGACDVRCLGGKLPTEASTLTLQQVQHAIDCQTASVASAERDSTRRDAPKQVNQPPLIDSGFLWTPKLATFRVDYE